MKKFLLALMCFCCLAGKSSAQGIPYSWNEGTFSNNNHTWKTNDGAFTIKFTTSNEAVISINSNGDLTVDEPDDSELNSSFELRVSLNSGYADYKIPQMYSSIKNVGTGRLKYGDGDYAPGTTTTLNSLSNGYKLEKKNSKTEYNTEPLHIIISNLTITAHRTLQTGDAYKIHFVQDEMNGEDKVTTTIATVKCGADEDEVFVIGNSGLTQGWPRLSYFFASNSNENENHYLLAGGVTEPTYTLLSSSNVYLTKSLHDAIRFNSGNKKGTSYQGGDYLGWDKENKEVVNKTTQVEDASFTTAVKLEKVAYPYLDVTLSGDELGTEGSFGTVYLPFPMMLPDGIEAYIGAEGRTTTKKDVYLGLTQVAASGGVLPGGAYLLHSTSSGSHKILPANAVPTANTSGNVFIGSTKNPEVSKGDADLYNAELAGTNPYVLSKKMTTIATGEKRDVVIGFYPYVDKYYPKGKAIYTTTEKSSLVRFHMGDAEDEVEGIETVATSQNSKAYDITGRCVTGAYKGLKIINGKKVY